MQIVSASFPTHVPGVTLNCVPYVDEEVRMEGYNVKDGFTLAPTVQIPGGGGGSVGGITRQIDRMVYRCLRLRSQRVVHDGIRWLVLFTSLLAPKSLDRTPEYSGNL